MAVLRRENNLNKQYMKKTMMSTYVRLLGFAKPLSRYAVPYFFYSVLHALFNTFTYTMIIPIIGTLFSE